MYISKFFQQFSQLGAREFRSLLKAHLRFAPRTSCAPLSQNRYLFSLHAPFCSTAEGSEEGDEENQNISVTFVNKDGKEQTIQVPLGWSMLEAAVENNIELEGACEGGCECSTCHVVVMDQEYYNKLEEPADEENDMLDQTLGLTATSRLGCQLIAKPELDRIRLSIPALSRDVSLDKYIFGQ